MLFLAAVVALTAGCGESHDRLYKLQNELLDAEERLIAKNPQLSDYEAVVTSDFRRGKMVESLCTSYMLESDQFRSRYLSSCREVYTAETLLREEERRLGLPITPRSTRME
jgi:hypothetical protein